VNVKPSKDTLSERILSRSEVLDIIYNTRNQRDRLLLKLLYATGARISEICQLKWRDIKRNDNGGARITLFGKGNKTRVVLIGDSFLDGLLAFKTSEEAPVFQSRKKSGHLSTTQAFRIFTAAAKRAGIEGNVSPHWFRHSHASHALDNNAPIHTVQKSLGHSSITTTERYLHSNPKDSSGLYIQV
jgi:integrase/recombinase XerD